MNIETLDLLREALPYIQKFQGKTFVVKFSGKVTEDRENLASLAEELALLHQVGIRICVVHGGGKQLTELADKLGVDQTVRYPPAEQIVKGRRGENFRHGRHLPRHTQPDRRRGPPPRAASPPPSGDRPAGTTQPATSITSKEVATSPASHVRQIRSHASIRSSPDSD